MIVLQDIIEKLYGKVIFTISRNQFAIKKNGLAAGYKISKSFLRLRNPFSNEEVTLEDRFLLSLKLKSKTVYDIGAHIGIHTLQFSKAVGSSGTVISFEPNPDSYRILLTHLRINSIENVRPINSGISSEKSVHKLVYRPKFSGTGSLDAKIQANLLARYSDVRCVSVSIDTIDNLIRNKKIPPPEFIKIDIEGAEYAALLGMADTCEKLHPQLFIEIHGVDEKTKLSNAYHVIKFLKSMDYEVYHIESKKKITLQNWKTVKIGHVFAYLV